MDGNKIRRGPGRRLAKERRKRGMDQDILHKYMALPPALQQKINDSIVALYELHHEDEPAPEFQQKESGPKIHYRKHQDPRVEYPEDNRGNRDQDSY